MRRRSTELRRFAQAIEALRVGALLGDETTDELPEPEPDADQFFLLALSALEQAQRFAELATRHQFRQENQS